MFAKLLTPFPSILLNAARRPTAEPTERLLSGDFSMLCNNVLGSKNKVGTHSSKIWNQMSEFLASERGILVAPVDKVTATKDSASNSPSGFLELNSIC